MIEFEHVLPKDIEKESFNIITRELKAEGKELPEETANVILRVIHTTADLGLYDTMTFSNGAMARAKEAVSQGAVFVTDTTMALSGINKKALKKLSCEAYCYIADEDVSKKAMEEGNTRAFAAVEKAIKEHGKRPLIFACGNAPTALIAMAKAMDEGFKPALIIGVPVGFVNVVQSKELILTYDVPSIINRGRKGGSNVAAAIVNAILYECGGRENG